MAKQKATIEVCDNPECGNSEIVTKDEPATGYHLGRGFWVSGGGGPIPATYACSEECILPAVRANVERGLS